MPDKLLRTDEVAVILDIPADRVATMAREGLLPAIRCGRSWRFAPSRLTEWMESGGAGGWKRSSVFAESHRGAGMNLVTETRRALALGIGVNTAKRCPQIGATFCSNAPSP